MRRNGLMKVFGLLTLGVLFTLSTAVATENEKSNVSLPESLRPEPRSNEDWWVQRMEQKNAEAKQGGWEIVFVGDSITHGLGDSDTWQEYYTPRKALNLGFSGDRTEHVLWRFDHGNFDGINPKAFVVMIGTNNTGHRKEQPADTALGVAAIVERLTRQFPESKVLLLAIFPRGATTDDELRQRNDSANAILKVIFDGEGGRVKYLDLSERFLTADGKLPTDIMPDLLHPNAKGQKIWADAIEADVKAMLGEK